jgi:hypothetical protein
MPDLRFLRLPQVVIRLAVCSGALWLMGIALPILAWNARNASPYWPCNHFISELGFPATSALNWVFNATEAVASLLVLPVGFALAALLRTRVAAAAASWMTLALLCVSGLGLLGVGLDVVRPAHVTTAFLNLHVALALVCFAAWAVAVALFTVSFWRGRDRSAPTPVLVIAGVLGLAVAVGFIGVGVHFLGGVMERRAHPEPALKAILESKATPEMFHRWLETRRPDLIVISTTEWTLLGAMLLWHGMAVAFLLQRRKGAAEPPRDEPLPVDVDPWWLTARWISIVAHPFSFFVVLLLLPFFLRGQWSSVRVAGTIVLAALLPLGIFMWRRYRAGRWATVDASDRRDRPMAFAALYVVLLPMLAYFQWVEHAPALVRGGLIVGAMMAVAAAANRWIKGSGHMAFASFGAVVLIYFIPVSAAVFTLLLPALAWSRLHLRRHTLVEVIGGSLLGLLAGGIGVSG